MIQHLANVISNQELMPGVYLMWLQSPEIASKAKPGQFLMVKCGVDTVLRRPLSVHRVNNGIGAFGLLFAKIGKGTDWLSTRQKGDKVDLLGHGRKRIFNRASRAAQAIDCGGHRHCTALLSC